MKPDENVKPQSDEVRHIDDLKYEDELSERGQKLHESTAQVKTTQLLYVWSSTDDSALQNVVPKQFKIRVISVTKRNLAARVSGEERRKLSGLTVQL
ncbi:hypothetical protein R1flu_008985 [Riccia fluitans]|uniref:Uncharacterized protein n=1 Tax=Riccia fluitans TaxID=41844 RepID=A0ABD1Z0T0_9MARC